ncbi:MAG: hypothetical protein WCC04_13010 [Terriglobales bacterium]
MLHARQFIASLAVGLLLGVMASLARADDPSTPQTAPAPAAHHRPHKKKAVPPPPLVLPPLPAGPLQQVPLPQLPATAPTVTYQNGLLTILAQNATLGEILKQVRKLTGASIDLPANGAPERVVTEIGPGAPRDVLAALLNGTQFNYVMLGSSSDPAAIASIALTPKPGSGEAQTAANGAQPGTVPPPGSPVQPFRQQMIASAPPPEAADDDANTGDETDENTDDAEQQGQPQPAVAQPSPPDQQANPNQPNAGPRTPEQLLQMMRQGPPPMIPPPAPATPPEQ